MAEPPPLPTISVLAPKEGSAQKKVSKLAIGIDTGTSAASGRGKENCTLGRSHGRANINDDFSDVARCVGATSKKGFEIYVDSANASGCNDADTVLLHTSDSSERWTGS
ncbi:hypothetical protein CONPUDRAFT_152889 [Coniophora puteana RWD-64-598 SS2]|uniref:Uncharacterized protein n=1 Tax=Coniophora puteana (strain RWD-64-598) TaxID=741705 RepID=A0A5M3MSD2_CONPW|nr:uncharacterized protein CONPUDRAFT_152889 [Coniophora puteana RWD-64-598 SS2]EIW81996.1 hypothetical protein CONPUDRAFT_152889 [Coniophora puteana RWD-64-598 SS2]